MSNEGPTNIQERISAILKQIDGASPDEQLTLMDDLKQLLGEINKLEISYSENRIGVAGAKALAEALKTNTTLTKLYQKNSLYENSIGPEGVQAFGDMLKINKKLSTLHLFDNQIGPEETRYLSEALKTNSTLKELSLVSNKVGPVGAQYLAQALKINTTLTKLDLGDNNIGTLGAQHLSDAIKTNTTLTELFINANKIDDAGIQYFIEALPHNGALRTLYCYENASESKLSELSTLLTKQNQNLNRELGRVLSIETHFPIEVVECIQDYFEPEFPHYKRCFLREGFNDSASASSVIKPTAAQSDAHISPLDDHSDVLAALEIVLVEKEEKSRSKNLVR